MGRVGDRHDILLGRRAVQADDPEGASRSGMSILLVMLVGGSSPPVHNEQWLSDANGGNGHHAAPHTARECPRGPLPESRRSGLTILGPRWRWVTVKGLVGIVDDHETHDPARRPFKFVDTDVDAAYLAGGSGSQ